jgi:hypothetical protein
MKRAWPIAVITLLLLIGNVLAQQSTPLKSTPTVDSEFFEKNVRPILADNCVSCHSGTQPMGGLRFDPITEIQKGNAKGPVIIPGDPEKSRLLRAVRHLPGIASMPPDGKLTDEQIATLTEWVRQGAPLPAAQSPAKSAVAGFPLNERRQYWAYLPVKRPPVPVVKNKNVLRNPIDAFLQAKREASGIRPAPPADKRTLIRRVTYDLIGLPPTPAEVDTFLADSSPNAYEKVVDRLLASPHYGERWARHWLDLVRYAESLGHEFDFSIFNAYRYRDYVIRAFNEDLPYNQFVGEHLAGDLLPHPRRDPTTGINESLLATGFFWFGEGKHSPVDVRQEQADHIDNQIDVLGKTFLAQTISCARCHNHKFDPIPTRDYYALYGILKSSRYQQAIIDSPTVFDVPREKIRHEKKTLDCILLASQWLADLKALPDDRLTEVLSTLATVNMQGRSLAPFSDWKASGPAFSPLAQPGDLVFSAENTPELMARPTAHSALFSRRFEGVLRSPTFTLQNDYLHLRVAGKGGRVSLIIDNFMMIREPLYGALNQTFDDPTPHWRTIDVRRWKGQEAYIEVADSSVPNPGTTDTPVLPVKATQPNDTWISLYDALLSDIEEPRPQTSAPPWKNNEEARDAMNSTLQRWAQNQVTERDASALTAWNALLQAGLLDTSAFPPVTKKIAEIEATIPVPQRALAICEGTGRDEHVFVRGNPKTPGEDAPRLRLAVCFTENQMVPPSPGSGRLELANWITSPTHPLAARVMVNRLWKHHFGTGIVSTPDDFGHMGEKPSNPALLDWLASEFVRQGWSIKRMQRLMVLSDTYRMSSRATDPDAERKDPKNTLLHRMPVRRLEAEAVRDALLAVSGRLSGKMYGPSIHPYLDGQDGRGIPPTGPLDGDGRRTIYLEVRRNFPSLFLMAFDFPTPFTTIGRRTVSNVPTQSLTLMNSDFVWQQADVWAQRLQKASGNAPQESKIRMLYQMAYARPPRPEETVAILHYLNGHDDQSAWTDVCHALYNAKEFIYVF